AAKVQDSGRPADAEAVQATTPADSSEPAMTTQPDSPAAVDGAGLDETANDVQPAAEEKPTRRRSRRATKAQQAAPVEEPIAEEPVAEEPVAEEPVADDVALSGAATDDTVTDDTAIDDTATDDEPLSDVVSALAAPTAVFTPLFQAPDPAAAEPVRRRRRRRGEPDEAEAAAVEPTASTLATGGAAGAGADDETATDIAATSTEAGAHGPTDGDDTEDGRPRRRRRGGRGRRRRGEDAEFDDESGESSVAPAGDASEASGTSAARTSAAASSNESDTGTGTGTGTGTDADHGDESDDSDDETSSSRRRRRRRRRSGSSEAGETTSDDPPNTVVRVRESLRSSRRDRDDDATGRGRDDDEPTALRWSTRLEAKKQRRREGREAGRRRPPILSEAEFLARRESVDRVMVVRQSGDRTQIGVLEDGILVEHYVNKEAATSYVGNVYLGRVQNVLPSMEAAFVDIGKGRNAVLYAGEVNWDLAGLDGQPRRIENALKSGDPVLVQVTKDPVGHKGARLTAQISLPGRFLVYVPNSSMTGISRKLPDVERNRLKKILKKIVPEDAGVIVRTAAEGASEEELTRDVARLQAQWEDIQKKSQKTSAAPSLLYGEPDLTVRVIRDIFNEDFGKVVVSGDSAWDEVQAYVGHVAPDLLERISRWTREEDVFAHYRIDEQLTKALDRKVWLPSGGYLIIDRTEAMVVVDVNTGKFVG
ncbi:MAG: Rne/Rng family ribonuclease, partial [Actinomycetes bacterium]